MVNPNTFLFTNYGKGTAEDVEKFTRRQVRVTKEHNEECRKLLALMGIPVIIVNTFI